LGLSIAKVMALKYLLYLPIFKWIKSTLFYPPLSQIRPPIPLYPLSVPENFLLLSLRVYVVSITNLSTFSSLRPASPGSAQIRPPFPNMSRTGTRKNHPVRIPEAPFVKTRLSYRTVHADYSFCTNPSARSFRYTGFFSRDSIPGRFSPDHKSVPPSGLIAQIRPPYSTNLST
jgi:hypothetical protein